MMGSPGRDAETDEKMEEVIALMNSGKADFSTVVPLYILNINHCLDMMSEDLRQVIHRIVRDP